MFFPKSITSLIVALTATQVLAGPCKLSEAITDTTTALPTTTCTPITIAGITVPEIYTYDTSETMIGHPHFEWSTLRVVCLRDAAYALTPLTGMGTSLAVTGAYIFASELSKLEEGERPATALDAYERTFRPFVDETLKLSSFISGIMHSEAA
ncbi:hypothetical protein G7Z17_g3075 [Cylindrodendrum hubeiense]|uniref:FAD-binding domain-containing protein n=1 Tax=Cylindrodendrum hubeiense TaxID=595255 RepID=A0A9P5HLZ1_9HYPO|nr:hypothetical protein G7Z17_g3075 [Cylindrodendrum hubeiense]